MMIPKSVRQRLLDRGGLQYLNDRSVNSERALNEQATIQDQKIKHGPRVGGMSDPEHFRG